MRKFICYLALLVAGIISGGVQASHPAVERFLADPAFAPASIGICVTRATNGEIIAAYNERQAIIPASTVKLLTTATALRLLGSDFTPTTQVDLIQTPDNKHYLFIQGGGDPSLASAYGKSHPADDFIHRITNELQSRGIRHIDGITVDNSYFEGYAVSPKHMVEDIIWDYGTGCHAFSYRDNRVTAHVRYNGATYEIARIEPANRFEITTNLAKGERENIVVQRNGKHFILSGTIPAKRESYKLALAIPHPDELFREDLTERLQQIGITVEESTNSSPLDATGEPILRYSGDNLGQLTRTLNVRSDNLYAESVLRHISTHNRSRGNAEKGIETIRRYWHHLGADSLELFLYDGSGLARNNKISARYIAQVLNIMAQDKQVGDTFIHSLPVAGKEGSVASFMRNHPLPGELRLKSGSMSDVHAYAGYYTANGERYSIVILVNNYTCSRAKLKQKIATLLTQLFS